MTDALLHLYKDDDTKGRFDKNAIGTKDYLLPNCNFIWWVFDTRSQTCRISKKCGALIVGSFNTSFCTELIDRLENKWGQEAVDKLTIDSVIEIDSGAWEISIINEASSTVMLSNKDTGISIKSIEYCISQTM